MVCLLEQLFCFCLDSRYSRKMQCYDEKVVYLHEDVSFIMLILIYCV